MTDKPEFEFNVVQFYSDKAGPLAGKHEFVRRYVTAEEAVLAARHYTDNVACRTGIIDRVIITDGGDFTVFQWEYGKGVTFPPKEGAPE
jgi:hypothetical protein